MNKPKKLELDCVKMKDEAQKKLMAEMKGMTVRQQIKYLNEKAEKFLGRTPQNEKQSTAAK